MDVTAAAAIRTAHEVVRAQAENLAVLINNAAIYSSRGSDEPSERLGELSFEDALTVLRVNAVAPLLVAQQFLHPSCEPPFGRRRWKVARPGADRQRESFKGELVRMPPPCIRRDFKPRSPCAT